MEEQKRHMIQRDSDYRRIERGGSSTKGDRIQVANQGGKIFRALTCENEAELRDRFCREHPEHGHGEVGAGNVEDGGCCVVQCGAGSGSL